MSRLLVVDDEQSMREFLNILFVRAGHTVSLAASAEEALRLLAAEHFELVLTDLRLGEGTGLEVLEASKRYHPDTEVILLTAFASTENAVQAMKAGAYDYLQKPFKKDAVQLVVQNALERQALRVENASLRARLGEQDATLGQRRERLAGLRGRSEPMQRLYRLIEKVAPTRSTVLIGGESGTGKELVAKAIHALSSRSAAPFVAINCGAIPEGLIESELFGHERGAFTGAHQDKQGLFEAGSGGTVFLDEVGELPQAMQVKLLRVLQEQRVKRVGGVSEREVDLRIVAATNRELEAEVAAGRFREDLFYRLNVLQIHVPPLREHSDDIPLLVEHFLERLLGPEPGRLRLSREALAALMDHPFRGNVRELENLIERAVALAEGDQIQAADLPPAIGRARSAVAVSAQALPEEGLNLEAHLASIESSLLKAALERSHGHKGQAAKLLKLSFRSFRYRLKKLNADS